MSRKVHPAAKSRTMVAGVSGGLFVSLSLGMGVDAALHHSTSSTPAVSGVAASLTTTPPTAATIPVRISPPSTVVPTTAAPTTAAPTTATPVTDPPTTAAPVTDPPTTAAPVTDPPTTATPVTDPAPVYDTSFSAAPAQIAVQSPPQAPNSSSSGS